MSDRRTIARLLADDHSELDRKYRHGGLARRLSRRIRLLGARRSLLLIASALGGLAIALGGLYRSGLFSVEAAGAPAASRLESMLVYLLVFGVGAVIALFFSQRR